VIVPEDAARPLAAALDKIVCDAFWQYSTPRDAELHAHTLMQGVEDWQKIAPQIRVRGGICDKAMRAIGDHDVAIVCCGLDVPSQKRKYKWPDPPHRVVLQHTMERVHEYAAQRQQHALLIAD
jgi:hypothetical protein